MIINDQKSGNDWTGGFFLKKKELTHQKFDQFSLRRLGKSFTWIDNSILYLLP
jgi:hypothetical protein